MHERRAGRVVVLGCAAALVAGCSAQPELPPAGEKWQIEVVAEGLANPWDLAVLPDQTLLVTEKAGRLVHIDGEDQVEVVADLSDVDSTGEGGLMALELAPDFTDSGRFYTCQATSGDVRVIAWTLNETATEAVREPDPVIDGITHATTGRHSGCQLAFDSEGALLVGTGDAAMGTAPQDLTSLNGKLLRVDPHTGEPAAGNPGFDRPEIYSFGHRNIQGIAIDPATGDVITVEHGPSVDDEVNRIVSGGNYGWNPDGDGSYDESVPMTDDSLGDVVPALWSSGSPTVAASGGAFLAGDAWGPDEGMLAVAALKGQRLLLMEVSGDAASDVRSVAALEDEYGRLRAVVPGGDGVIYLTTSNKADDQILRVSA